MQRAPLVSSLPDCERSSLLWCEPCGAWISTNNLKSVPVALLPCPHRIPKHWTLPHWKRRVFNVFLPVSAVLPLLMPFF